MKIALYLMSRIIAPQVLEVTEWRDNDSGYIRLSETVDVDFPPLPPEVTAPKQLAVLDAAEEQLRVKFTEKLIEISTQRSNLLSLTHQVTP